MGHRNQDCGVSPPVAMAVANDDCVQDPCIGNVLEMPLESSTQLQTQQGFISRNTRTHIFC